MCELRSGLYLGQMNTLILRLLGHEMGPAGLTVAESPKRVFNFQATHLL